MSSKHVTKKFLNWQEGTLKDAERLQIEEHLKECPSCKAYYETWVDVLENPDLNALPQLSVDPYLPTRILSGEVEESAGKNNQPAPFAIRWSFAAALTFIGLSTGAILGIATVDTDHYSEQDIASAYYEVFTQQENQYNLEQLLGLENGGENED
jgi:anti-sigma factor RsiW